jgi:hypothetical protein
LNTSSVNIPSSFSFASLRNPSAITEEDIDVFASHISAPGGTRAALEHFRAFPMDAEQNKESTKGRITLPVLVLGGDIHPALGGDLPGNFALSSMQPLAANVTCDRHHSSTFRTLDSRRAARICNRTACQVLWW